MKDNTFKKMTGLTLATSALAGVSLATINHYSFNTIEVSAYEATVSTKSSSFVLDDWTYQDNGTEIVLSAYNGSTTNLVIPGEYNGQRVVLSNLSILPRNLRSLTIQEVNGEKVGLETDSLAYGLANYYSLNFVDLRGLDTSSVTDMSHLFESSGVSLAELAGLNVSSVENMSDMFKNAGTSPRAYDLSGWNLSSSVDTTDMFYHDSFTMGLIIATHPTLTSYDYEAGNLFGIAPGFSASGLAGNDWVEGTFDDRSNFYQHPSYQVLPSRDKNYIQGIVNDIYANAPTPTLAGYNFLGYGLGPYTLQNDSLEEVYLAFECSYSAEWEKIHVNQAPTITAPALTVGQGSTNFNPLDYVTAEDPEEGPIALTEANIVSSDVNLDEPGVYQIVYEVSDREGLKARATQTITVNGTPKIFIDSKVIQVGDSFDPLGGVTASDPEDGPIPITIDNVIQNQVNPDVPGSYQVWYQVKDSFGNITRRWITVLVNEAPKLTLNKPVIQVGTNLDLLNWVTVTDKEQGTIILNQSNTKVTHNINPSKPGIYQVTYEVTDGYGGVRTQTFDIVVNDSPTIQTNHVTINVGDSFNALDHITATDAFGNKIQLDQSNILSSNVNPDQAGSYQVTYQVTDAYGYKSTATINVTVKAKQENLLGAVTVGEGQNLTLNQIIQMTGNGYIDGNINITSSNVDLTKPGSYEIIFEYTNPDGTVSIKKLPVIVEVNTDNQNGNTGNVVVDLDKVVVEQGSKMTASDLIQNANPDLDMDRVTIIFDNLDTSKPGEYEIIFDYKHEDGTVSSHRLPVIVEVKQDTDGDHVMGDNDSTNNEGVTPNHNEDSSHKEESTDSDKENIETGFTAGAGLLFGGLSLFQGIRLFRRKK